MQLSHTFELPAPVDSVFDVFSRLDLLAPCFPGATVWGRDGEVYHGAVKIKFGPFPLVFEGTARVVRTDLTDRRLVVTAHARDRRGAAAGAATVTAGFESAGSGGTRIVVSTDLDLTGRPAQLGSGAVQSVSDRLLEQFAGCLSARFASGLTTAGAEPGAAAGSTGAPRVSGTAEAAGPHAGAAGTAAQDSGTAGPAAPDAGAVAAGGARADLTGTSTSPTATGRPGYAYRPPAQPEGVPHLQVLPDVVRTWLPWLAGAVGGGALLVFVVRWLRSR